MTGSGGKDPEAPGVCAVCREGLLLVTWNDSPPRWQHRRDTDHDPDPVFGLRVSDQRSVCDFCSTPGPEFVFTVVDRPVVSQVADAKVSLVGGGTSWAACRQCSDLVVVGDQAAVTERAVTLLMAAHGIPESRKQQTTEIVAGAHHGFWESGPDCVPHRYI